MAEERAGLSVLAVLADAGSEDLRADQGTYAADHVDAGGTGKIMKTQFCQPSAAPDPMCFNGIDKG